MLSVNTGHTHALLHLAEGCSWCGPISFGCCSEGKHTPLIRPTDWLEGGEASEEGEEEKSPWWKVKISQTDKGKTGVHKTSYNFIDLVFNQIIRCCSLKSNFQLNISSRPRLATYAGFIVLCMYSMNVAAVGHNVGATAARKTARTVLTCTSNTFLIFVDS